MDRLMVNCSFFFFWNMFKNQLNTDAQTAAERCRVPRPDVREMIPIHTS